MKINKQDKSVFQEMAARWPSLIVARTEVERFTGGVVTEKYIANLDSRGKGPSDRVRIGRKIAYPVSSFVNCLESRSAIV